MAFCAAPIFGLSVGGNAQSVEIPVRSEVAAVGETRGPDSDGRKDAPECCTVEALSLLQSFSLGS
jgi:hypothetical protein